MLKLQLLYRDRPTFEKMLHDAQWSATTPCLVRIYTAVCTPEQAVSIAKEIKQTLPGAQIIGCSGSGIIFCGKQYEDDTLVIVESFENAQVSVQSYCFAHTSATALAQQIAFDFGDSPVACMHLLCGAHFYDVHNFVETINQSPTHLPLTGGIAGDVLSKDIVGYVFTENGMIEQGIVVAAISGETLHNFHAVNISHIPISPSYTLRHNEGSLLLQIEDKSAVEWCREQFGMEDLTEYTDWQVIAENDALVRFPLILEGHGGASRFIKFNRDAQKISLYFSQLNNDTRFRIGYTSPIACVQQCFEICNNLVNTPVESLFCYTCLFRKLYLENCAEWELRPFLSGDICGVFMMGEIGVVGGKNEFLNGSCSLIGLAEDPTAYLQPNFNVFDDLYKIKDDNQQLVNYVLQKQSTAMSKENEELIQKLVQQQENESQKLFIDSSTGLSNSFKFAQDNQLYAFDKMCMVHIENYDLLNAMLGQAGYSSLLEKVIAEVRTHTQASIYRDQLSYYILNSNTLFMVANQSLSDAVFIQIATDYFDRYQTIKSPEGGDLLINRFVLILHQEDLLASALKALHKYKDLQTRFVISNDSLTDTPALNQEMQMINILNDVIEHKRVIPYFQSIHSNRTMQIGKYEALMRIQDANGTIYPPGAFMEISKKYHMYSAISRLMIEQVFALFAGRAETVGINLSASDINYDEMQEFIFSLLEKLGRVDNIVFELLEDESFQQMDKLQLFVEKVRSYGVKIAIDDFGSGYSNFVRILQLEPDYIKIDISIVRQLDSSPLNQKVLKNIVFLGKQLNAQLVAEGVENEAVQSEVESMDVHFSQGFLFARPIPYEQLHLPESTLPFSNEKT